MSSDFFCKLTHWDRFFLGLNGKSVPKKNRSQWVAGNKKEKFHIIIAISKKI